MAFVTPPLLPFTTTARPRGHRSSRGGVSLSNPSRRSYLTPCATASSDGSEQHASPATAPAFSAQGMTVDDFFEQSIGEWQSQRSSHTLLWAQFEQITSNVVISRLDHTTSDVIDLCASNSVSVDLPFFSCKMSWEGDSDWDDEVSEGETVLSVIKDSPTHGRLLRSVGYAETIPAVGTWRMTSEGVFVLNTTYEAAAAEERIWFAKPNLRMRVSQILTNSGEGVLTASFSTEIRRNLS